MSRFGAAIFGCDGTKLSKDERAFFGDAQPFGFILFARNIDNLEQVKSLCAELRDSVGHAAPILIDQEGGRVQRMRAPLATDWPAPLEHVMGAGNAAEGAFNKRALYSNSSFPLLECDCSPAANGSVH